MLFEGLEFEVVPTGERVVEHGIKTGKVGEYKGKDEKVLIMPYTIWGFPIILHLQHFLLSTLSPSKNDMEGEKYEPFCMGSEGDRS